MVYDSVYEANKYFRLPAIPATAVTEETLDSTNGTASWNVDNGGSDITIDTGNNEIDITGTGQKSGYYDLGASVSASAWVLRFKIASSGSPSGNPLFWVGMFDVNTIDSRNTNVDGISLMIYTGSTYKLSMKNGSHMDSGGSQTDTSPTVSADTTTRYVEIVRNGSNAILTFYDSDTYTTSIGTCTVAITGTSFRYLCAISYFEGSGRTYSLSNVKLYNGVTSVEPAHPDVRKQHFWDWFSSSTLNSRWTERNGISGDGTVSTSYAVMADEVNGGVKISSNTGTWGKTALSFNGKRQFDATASVMIFNGRRTGHSVGYNITGLSDHVLIWDNAPQEVGIKNYSEDSSYKVITSDGTQQSETDFNPTVAIDTNFHNFQIVNTSTSNSGYIDGVLGLSKTTNRPTGKVQPQMLAMTKYAEQASAINQIYYIEVYNT